MSARTSARKGLASLVVVVGAVSLSCGSGGPGPSPESRAGEWEGVIETEGDVTTVRTVSGSVWPGPASLVEETSIGVDLGEDPYMLGSVTSVYATDDEILVLDSQVPVLRVYDMDGGHLRDVGGPGQGPGEFDRPVWVTGMKDGRILVYDPGGHRINVYSPDGTPVETWPASRAGEVRPRCCLRPMVPSGDVVWMEIGVVNRREQELRFDPGMRAYGPEGALGEPFMVPDLDYPRWTLEIDGRESESVPYAPRVVWAIASPGVMVVGSSDEYSFELRSPEAPVIRIERYWEPVAPIEEEIRYSTRRVHEGLGRSERGEERDLDWDGRMPATKPAFEWLVPTAAGDLWVMRQGRAEPVPGCDPGDTVESSWGSPTPIRCFETPWIVDAFDGEGRYLGEVRVPGDAFLSPPMTFIRGDMVVTVVQDEAGTDRVKRYRIVIPER